MTVDVFAVSHRHRGEFEAEVFRFRGRGLVVGVQVLVLVRDVDPVRRVLVRILFIVWVFIVVALAAVFAARLLVIVIKLVVEIIVKLVLSPSAWVCLCFHWLLGFGLSKTEKTVLSFLFPNVCSQLHDHRTPGCREL